MVGKRGKKKKGTSSLEKIGPALIPAVALTAVPHSPPPRAPPGTPLRLASEIFGSSFNIDRSTMAAAAVQRAGTENDGAFSDPESSLYDYQQMEEAGYSTVGFGTWHGKGNRKSYSDRERVPTPPFVRKGATVGVTSQTGAMYHILEPQEEDLSDEDLYAVPSKGRGIVKKTLPEEDVTSMDRTQRDVQRAMQEVHDLPEDTVVMRRTAGLASASLPGSSSGRGTMRREDFDSVDTIPEEEFEGAAAAAAVSTNQNAATSSHDGQAEQRDEAYVYLRQQMAAEGGTGSGQVSSRRSHTPRSTASMSADLELHRLKEENQQLHDEVLNLRKVAAAIRVGDEEGAQNILENHQLEELREENELLKNTVGKLNQELSRYQAKFRPLSDEEQSRLQGLPSDGPVPSWLINKRYLAPLFLAYDDQLAEKDEIIAQCQQELHALKQRAEEVVRENQRLQLRSGGGGDGRLSSAEWQQLQEQARLVLEENQILVEQLDVQQSKVKDLCAQHIQEVSRLTKKLTASETEKEEAERELEEVKRKFKDIRHKYDHLQLESGHMTMQDHIHSVADLKRSVVEEKEQLEKEREKMANKLKASEDERRQQTLAAVELTAENKQLKAEIKALHRAIKRTQNKMLILQKAVQQSENKELVTQNELANVIRIVEKTALERDTAFRVVKEQQHECKETVTRMVGNSVVMGKLEEKLKMYKLKASAKLESVAQKLKEQDEAFNRQKQEYEREIRYLRLLVKEKEEMIQGMAGVKKEVEEDLEAMWQAASSENQRLKDILRKSVYKLRDHPSLKAALDEQEELEQLVLFKDE